MLRAKLLFMALKSCFSGYRPIIMPIKSPCIGTCVLDPKAGHCMGCYRTGDEIGAWMSMSDGAKKRVIASAQKRKANTPAKSSQD
ncbi:DUF1289 domain-containing protein [Thalassospira profundimaris]|nr:DUF1289 domain-containing protein [Thalassospira profundimaris]